MRRAAVWVLAILLIAVAGRESRAQATAGLPSGYGGFGLEYTQTIPSNSLILDRWWMLEPTQAVGSAVPASGRQSANPAAAVSPTRTARSSRVVRSLSRTSGRRATSGTVTTRTAAPMPTGSLAWPGAGVMPLYSPAQRYATYGYGYGVSPYGTADYGAAYKGMEWGN